MIGDDLEQLPFRESAEELLAMWRAGEYKNPKDAIVDCRTLLYAVPGEHAAYRPMLEAILAEATRRLAEIAPHDAILATPSAVAAAAPSRAVPKKRAPRTRAKAARGKPAKAKAKAKGKTPRRKPKPPKRRAARKASPPRNKRSK